MNNRVDVKLKADYAWFKAGTTISIHIGDVKKLKNRGVI